VYRYCTENRSLCFLFSTFAEPISGSSARSRSISLSSIAIRNKPGDRLINARAGVGPADGLIGLRASESTEEELQNIFNINLFSLVALNREFLPLLKNSEAGRIVTLASILGSLTLQAMDPSPIAPLRKFAYNTPRKQRSTRSRFIWQWNSRTPISR
jgi:NAD(P)-dependent dehydrogenase (short-subunit alcohol dehydrogenase family)